MAVFEKLNFRGRIDYENADKESIEKLIRYVDNQSKAEFITNSFDKIISSLFLDSDKTFSYHCITDALIVS
jgi:hypothetical protein